MENQKGLRVADFLLESASGIYFLRTIQLQNSLKLFKAWLSRHKNKEAILKWTSVLMWRLDTWTLELKKKHQGEIQDRPNITNKEVD